MERQQFTRLAAFNKFALDAEAEEALYQEVSQVVEWLSPLAAADLGDTPIMVQPESVRPVYREDVAEQELDREIILAQAPEQAEHCFAVPRVAD